VDSPAYACQVVLVTKLTAAFQAMWSVTASWPSDSHSLFCSRRNAYRNRTETAEKASTLRAYTAQVCSLDASTPTTRVQAALDARVPGARDHPEQVIAERAVDRGQGHGERADQ
jgi:hypothetical protein